MKKTIALTGATGHLGTCLIHQLIEEGHKIKALYFRSTPQITHKNVIWIKGDLCDSNTIIELIADSKVLIHCAASISIHGDPTGSVFRTNVKGTKTVVNACKQKNDIRLIHISSTQAVNEKPLDVQYNENRVPAINSNFAYNKTKALAEVEVLKAFDEHNLDVIIHRLPALIGIYDYKPSLMGQAIIDLYEGKLPAIISGGYNYLDIQDSAKSIVKSIESGKSGEVYLLAGKFHSIQEIACEVEKHSSNKAPKITLPIWLMMTFLPFVKIYSLISQQPGSFTYESLMVLKNAHKKMDYSKAEKELNHTITPLNETIEHLIAWYRKENMIQ